MNKSKFTQKNVVRSCTLSSTHQNPILLMLNPNTKFIDIMKLIQIVWRQNADQLRLFLCDGTEIEETDLINIKKGTHLFALLKNEEKDLMNLKLGYDIIKRIGEGGQALVFLGKHKVTNELVAIKKVSAATQQDQALEMLEQESLILKQLDHQNIVKLYEKFVCSESKEVILIMEYLHGGQLLAQANSQLTEVQAKHFSNQIVDAIAYCHERKIVHCDLKLENIMLSTPSQKSIKIIDFGVSNYFGQPFDKDNILGTLSYLAPEVLSTSYKFIQPGQDVWAIGCIIYGLVFGKLPFEGNSPSETYRNILSCNYQIPKKSVSKELMHLLSIIFVANPKERANIFDIQSHRWLNEHAKILKLNINGINIRIGRSSSVVKMHSTRKSNDEDYGQVISQRKIACSRRSVTRLDKISFVVKYK
ncbi:unnamed protein product (macronuclear) [Paramecium tetraurelia]|uniref:Protein kinase domain-containing protein n=1 Tax=Paramecium tetraurelia TaxID=5888 RepID=A0CFZ7_PARTE|nr:uncharacterized protein GSPATT00038156001 [Paramecium tetraurelia]CAK69714.1 unnamed protein product [Paramecium tetraurelia]|eukprot:XP_001437111.1 hypothetical protein (macronuclear) [Paramecium tetraurelia strain d4-2]